jgi:hypothetical protein
MIIRFLLHTVWVDGILRILNFFMFPIAWIYREKFHEKKGFLWWFLHDGNNYGDEYFLEKHGNKKTFRTAYKWAIRNPLHNYYYSHEINGIKTNYKGWATCQKPDSGKAWRTLKTCDKNGVYKDKHGSWIDNIHSILGKQRITFYINEKKYFRYSGCIPQRIIGNLWWCFEYKFGFENVNWAIQFKPLKFKKYAGNIEYYYINFK